MKTLKYIYIILGLLLVLTIGFYGYQLYGPKPRNNQPKIELTQEFTVTGVVRYRNPDEELKQIAQLNDSNLLIAQINKNDVERLPYNTKILYMEKYPEDVQKNLGKCVTVKGKVIAEWLTKTAEARTKDPAFSYNGVAFEVTEINQVDFDKCDAYKSAIENLESGEKVVITGLLRRTQRKIPDTGPADYFFHDNETNANLDVVPQNTAIWKKTEQVLNEKIAITAVKMRDTANTEYLVVTDIKEDIN